MERSTAIQYIVARFAPLLVHGSTVCKIPHITQRTSSIQHRLFARHKRIIPSVEADVSKKILQQRQGESRRWIRPKIRVGIVEVRVRDCAGVATSTVGTLAFGSRPYVIKKLHIDA